MLEVIVTLLDVDVEDRLVIADEDELWLLKLCGEEELLGREDLFGLWDKVPLSERTVVLRLVVLDRLEVETVTVVAIGDTFLNKSQRVETRAE